MIPLFSHVPHPAHQQILLTLLLTYLKSNHFLLSPLLPLRFSSLVSYLISWNSLPTGFCLLPFPLLVYSQHSHRDPIKICQLMSLFCSKPPVAFHLTQSKIKVLAMTAQLCRVFTQQPAPHSPLSVSCIFPFCPHDQASEVPGYSCLKAFGTRCPAASACPCPLFLPVLTPVSPPHEVFLSVFIKCRPSFTALPGPFLLYLFPLFILSIV